MTYSTHTKQAPTSDRPKSLQSPNDIKAVEISFEEHEIYAGERAIAKIILTEEDFETQPWIVTVNGIEIHRANTWMKCFHFITWHFTQGTLPEQEEAILRRSRCAIAAEKERVTIPVFTPLQKSKRFATTTNLVQRVCAKCFDAFQLSIQYLLLLLKILEKASGKESVRT